MLSGLGVREIHRFDWLMAVLVRGVLRGEIIIIVIISVTMVTK